LPRVVAAHSRLEFAVDPAVGELEALAQSALVLLEQADNHSGLVRVWHALGVGVANFRGREEDWVHAAQLAIRHSRLAGQPHMFGLQHALVLGPRPADEALDMLDAALPEAPHPVDVLHRAWLLAMLDRFDEAWAMAREASERWRELIPNNPTSDWYLSGIATLEGDHETAARYMGRCFKSLEALGRRAGLSTCAPLLGRSLCALERYDEAEPLARLGHELGDEHDVATQMLWRQVQARVFAHRGAHAKAEPLAREAVEVAEGTDTLNGQGDALCDLAEVLAVAGRADQAAEALEQALERYERKKNLAMVAQVRPRLEELRAE
jgi:tetratricopeptide (TPR) repeat protein